MDEKKTHVHCLYFYNVHILQTVTESDLKKKRLKTEYTQNKFNSHEAILFIIAFMEC